MTELRNLKRQKCIGGECLEFLTACQGGGGSFVQEGIYTKLHVLINLTAAACPSHAKDQFGLSIYSTKKSQPS